MECKRIECSNPVTGKQMYCSGACRKAASRTTKCDTSVTKPSVTSSVTDREPTDQERAEVEQAIDRLISNSPPCTPSQMTSPCHQCNDEPACDYLRNQTQERTQ